MEKSTIRGVVLPASPTVRTESNGTINSVKVKPIYIANIPALYNLAIETGTDPADVTVSNLASEDAEKSLKDLYDEGVIDVEIDDNMPHDIAFTGGR